MASLTARGGQIIDPVLTNISRRTRPQGFVADRISPRLSVPNEVVQYVVWNPRDNSATDVDFEKPDRAATKEIDLAYSLETAALTEYAAKVSISERERANIDSNLRLEQTKVELLQDQLALAREVRIAALLNTADAGGGLDNSMDATPANNWNVDAATIESDILAAKEAVFDQLGYEPNTIVLPYKVANAVAMQQDIRELFKYTVNGAQQLEQGTGILPNKIWGLNVLVPITRKASNAEGATDAFTSVWGDDVRVLYVDPSATYGSPSVSYTFQTRGLQTRRWVENDPRLDWIHNSEVLVETITSPFGGFIIKDVLS